METPNELWAAFAFVVASTLGIVPRSMEIVSQWPGPSDSITLANGQFGGLLLGGFSFLLILGLIAALAIYFLKKTNG